MKLTEVPEELIHLILSYDGRIKYKNDERYNIITPIISKKIKIMQKIQFSESGFYFDSGFNLLWAWIYRPRRDHLDVHSI